MRSKHGAIISLLLFTGLLAGNFPLIAQDSLVQVYNLRESWEAFNESSRSYTKVEPGTVTTTIRWEIIVEEGFDGWLEITAPRGSMVLVNGKYFDQVSGIVSIDLDSLYLRSSRNVFEFRIYNTNGLAASQLNTRVYERVTLVEGSAVDRNGSVDFLNFYILVSFLVLLFTGFLSKKFPRDTLDYFAILRSLSFRNREETLISTRPFNRTNVLFLILDATLIGFLIVAMVELTHGKLYIPFLESGMNIWQYILSWVVVSVIVLFAMMFKYLLIIIFTELFRLGDFRYIQYFNSLRFSLGAFFLLFILTGITYLSSRNASLETYHIFCNLLALLLFIRILIIFFKLRDYSSYKNFHLISYLCGTEIIPFIILYKLMLG